MFGLSKHGPDSRYGVVVDIGSATVTAAIVLSVPDSTLPIIVWSYKERVVRRESSSVIDLDKAIATATMNAFLQIGTVGLPVLRQYDSNSSLTMCSITVAAPWSHTVMQTASTRADKPYKVSHSLLDELASEIGRTVESKLDADELFVQLGLVTIDTFTISTTINGYRVSNPVGQLATEVSITKVVTVIGKSLHQTLVDAHNQILPSTDLKIQSFMQQFYASMQIFQPNLESYCMIDIGGEAIELGVVRDGLLEHATSTTNGHYALARKYTSATNGSFSDILQSIQHDHAEYVASLSAEKKSTVTAIFDLTVESLVELFRHTGDSLSIPKTIFLHTDSGFESFGSELVAIASKQATKVEHTIKNITTELFAEEAKNETKILLSCYVFHIANKNGARKS